MINNRWSGAAVDFVFGYDFFISYAHADGRTYPRLLRQRLEAIGYRTFLDESGYVGGDDLRLGTRRRVRMSRKLILLARPKAMSESAWVIRELETFVTRGRTPIVIDFGGALEGVAEPSPLAELLRNHLALRETAAGPDAGPSDHVVSELVRSFDAVRQETLRIRLFAGAALVFLLIAGVATMQYLRAEERRAQAVSRQLAMMVREASGVDRALLLGVQALDMAPTAEAKRTLLEQLAAWRQLERVLHADTGVNAVSFAGAGVVAGLDDGRVGAWAADTGVEFSGAAGLRGHGRATAVYVDGPSGDLWVGREDGRLDRYRGGTAGDRPEPVWPGAPRSARDRRVTLISGHPVSGRIAVGTGSGRIALIDAATGRTTVSIIEDETARVTALAFSRGGDRVFAGTHHGIVTVLDARSGRVESRIPRFDGGVALLGAAETAERLVVVSGHGALQVLVRREGGYVSESHATLPSLIASAAYHAGRNLVVLGDASGNVHLRDLYGEDAGFGSVGAHAAVVQSVAFSPDGGRLLSGAADGTVAVWTLDAEIAPASALPPLNPLPSVIRTDVRGRLVAAGTATGVAGVWRLDDGSWKEVSNLIAATEAAIGREALSPPAVPPGERTPGFEPVLDDEIPQISLDAGARVAVWTTRGGAVLWAAFDNGPGAAAVLARYPAPPAAVAVSGDGRFAVLASARSVAIHALPPRPGATPVRIDTPEPVRSVGLDARGTRVAIGLEDGRVGVWRTSDGASVAALARIHEAPVGGLLFAPDGRRIITFGAGGTDRSIAVTLIDRLSEPRRLQMRQPGGAVASLAASGPAGLLAAADHDGRVLLWGLADLGWITALVAGGSYVGAVAFDDRSHRLIAASSDRGTLSWSVDPADWVRVACRKANRDLTPAEWAEVLPDDGFRRPCAPVRQDAARGGSSRARGTTVPP